VTGNISRILLGQWTDTSRRTLVRRFAPFFVRPLTPAEVWIVLPPRCSRRLDRWMYGADGKWLHHDGVFLVHRDVTHRENLWWSYALNESYASWSNDLSMLGYYLSDHHPSGAVSDWKRGLIQAVITTFGNIPHQRCLAHIARYAAALLPKGSPFLATRRLRDIALSLRRIKTKADMQEWKQALTVWGYLYGDMLIQKTKAPRESTKHWWYTHGKLRSGWRLLTTDVDAFFVFLSVTNLPKTNNSLEGVNRNMKGKLGIHRGLMTAFQVSLLSWVMIFSRVKKPEDLRKLWDAWRRRS
jgi:transposase-like protein